MVLFGVCKLQVQTANSKISPMVVCDWLVFYHFSFGSYAKAFFRYIDLATGSMKRIVERNL